MRVEWVWWLFQSLLLSHNPIRLPVAFVAELSGLIFSILHKYDKTLDYYPIANSKRVNFQAPKVHHWITIFPLLRRAGPKRRSRSEQCIRRLAYQPANFLPDLC